MNRVGIIVRDRIARQQVWELGASFVLCGSRTEYLGAVVAVSFPLWDP